VLGLKWQKQAGFSDGKKIKKIPTILKTKTTGPKDEVMNFLCSTIAKGQTKTFV